MASENYDFLPPGEHTRAAAEPSNDPVTWPGAYVQKDRGGELPARIKEFHEYWEPTVGPHWYQLPRQER
jgi:hypothetical protein